MALSLPTSSVFYLIFKNLGGSIKTKHCYEEHVANALNIRVPRGLKIFQEFHEHFRLSKILSRFGLWTTYRLDPISLAVGIKRSHWKHSESQSLQSVPCSVTAVSPYSYLIQTITSLAFFLSSLLKKFPVHFCSILYYSLYITLPFLWCHPAFLLSGSHFPSCSSSSPTPDRTVLCDVRIGRIGSDYFCTRQDRNPHNAHLRVLSMLTGLALGWGPESYKLLCQAVEALFPSFWAQWNEICVTLRVDMMSAITF